MVTKIYVINIDNYHPEITAITLPAIQAYATRIGADVVQLTTRQFSAYEHPYEICQIYNLGANNDFSIYMDADVALAPQMLDLTTGSADSIGHIGAFGADSWFGLDTPFLEDTIEVPTLDENGNPILDENGDPVTVTQIRNFACNSAILVVPKSCFEVFAPSELSYEDAMVFVRRPEFVAQWNIARNVAKNHYQDYMIKSNEMNSGAQHNLNIFDHLNMTTGVGSIESIDLNALQDYVDHGYIG